MHKQSKQDPGPQDFAAERLVLLQVAGKRWGRPRQRMYRVLPDLGPERVDRAIEGLEAVGVVISKGKAVHESPALRRIDALDVIGV